VGHTVVTAELQTASVACFQRKIQLSVFIAYPYDSSSQLIRINGILPYRCYYFHPILRHILCVFYNVFVSGAVCLYHADV